MPVIGYSHVNKTLTTRCYCGVEATYATADVELGFSMVGMLDPNVIALPICACGRQQVLNRTWDAIPAAYVGSVADRSRRAVNAFALALKTAGKSNAACAAAHAAEQAAPPDVATADDLSIPYAGPPAT
jgi:hypothetical protein